MLLPPCFLSYISAYATEPMASVTFRISSSSVPDTNSLSLFRSQQNLTMIAAPPGGTESDNSCTAQPRDIHPGSNHIGASVSGQICRTWGRTVDGVGCEEP